MSLLDIIGKDCEDIIFQMKEEMEAVEEILEEIRTTSRGVYHYKIHYDEPINWELLKERAKNSKTSIIICSEYSMMSKCNLYCDNHLIISEENGFYYHDDYDFEWELQI